MVKITKLFVWLMWDDWELPRISILGYKFIAKIVESFGIPKCLPYPKPVPRGIFAGRWFAKMIALAVFCNGVQ